MKALRKIKDYLLYVGTAFLALGILAALTGALKVSGLCCLIFMPLLTLSLLMEVLRV